MCLRFDGSGLRSEWYVCAYDLTYNVCRTDIVVYDGSGIKRFQETRQPNQTCPSYNCVNWSFQGLYIYTTDPQVCQYVP